jgi:hypothetical protein
MFAGHIMLCPYETIGGGLRVSLWLGCGAKRSIRPKP